MVPSLDDTLFSLLCDTDEAWDMLEELEDSVKKVELSDESVEVLLLAIDSNVLSPPLLNVVEMYMLSVREAEVRFSVSVPLIG